MVISVWDRLLVPERYRQRVFKKAGGLSIPLMMELELEAKEDPLLVTNTRGVFVLSRRTKEGFGRYGFFECPLELESNLLQSLYLTLDTLSKTRGWASPATSVSEAIGRLIEPKSIVLSRNLIPSICGNGFTSDQVDTLMKTQGHIAVVNGMQVLAGNLPPGAAIVATQPKVLGVYTRVGDYLGLQLHDPRRTISIVRLDDVA